MKFISKYPLLTKLLLIQLSTISFGLVILLGVYQFTQGAQLASELSRLKEQVTPAIAARQEQWRAWKYLGLDSAIKEEADQLLKQFPIKSIDIILKNDLPKAVSRSEMVFPQDHTRSEDYVVLVSLNSEQIEGVNRARSTVLIALAAIALLFIGIILFSGRYIYRRVYLPIITLNQILSERDQTDLTDFSDIPAVGEMRDFLNTLSEMISKSLEEKEHLAHEAAFGGVAKSVAHDIRSPLSALNMIVGVAESLPNDQKDLMRAAITRINRIADGLLQRSKRSEPVESKILKQDELISNIVTSIVSEKRMEMRSKANLAFEVEISKEAKSKFAYLDGVQLSRVLSNILNNSLEAGATLISTVLSSTDHELVLSITDNGSGIPSSVVERLRTESFSHEKSDGHGLGIFSMRKFAESNEASYEISSEVGKGTNVKLRLKPTRRAVWFWDIEKLESVDRVVIVDDDPSIPIFWRQHLQTIAPDLTVDYCSSPEELERWLIQTEITPGDLFLVDFNFENSRWNGVEIVRYYGLISQSVIVTAMTIDREFIESIMSSKLVLFPKSHIGNS